LLRIWDVEVVEPKQVKSPEDVKVMAVAAPAVVTG
jgi:hypothetical protein